MTRDRTVQWQNALDKLPGLINIGRMSLLVSLITFYVVSQSLRADEQGRLYILQLFHDTEIYTWALVYTVLIVISLLYPQWQQQGTAIPSASAVADITMMAWLRYLAGGIDSGFGILMLPFVATSCLLSYGRYPWLYASYAALLIVISNLAIGRLGGHAPTDRMWLGSFMLIAGAYFVALLTAYSARYSARSRSAYHEQSVLLERMRDLTRLTLNHVQEAVVVLDQEQRVRLLNQQAQLYFPNLVINERSEMFCHIQQHWQRNPTQLLEMDTEVAERPVRVRIRTLEGRDVQLMMLFIRTAQELAKEAMAMKLSALGQLTANLAHEIRNPMSAIRHANSLLQEEEHDPLRLKLNSMIDGNIARIDKMLEEVSTLNKSDRIKKQAVDLMVFWRDFRHEFVLTRPQAQQCIHLKVSDGKLAVWCDPMHLQQIFWNLFNNAWRHSQQNAQAIRVVFRQKGQAEISIVVMDNGPGVSPENQIHLFEPFFTTEAEGTGLGLYVARELAHANMGRLDYRAQAKGFELILPRVLDE